MQGNVWETHAILNIVKNTIQFFSCQKLHVQGMKVDGISSVWLKVPGYPLLHFVMK